MTATPHDARSGSLRPLHPLRTLLLAGSVPLFLGVLLADMAYANTDQVQWKNFASWLNAGALVLAGLALAWAVVALIGPDRRHRAPLVAGALLVLGWLLGFVNALQHAKDAAATMPGGLVLSVVVLALVGAACWFALDPARLERVAGPRTAAFDRAEVRA
jgi:uncharacterized membrane protein